MRKTVIPVGGSPVTLIIPAQSPSTIKSTNASAINSSSISTTTNNNNIKHNSSNNNSDPTDRISDKDESSEKKIDQITSTNNGNVIVVVGNKQKISSSTNRLSMVSTVSTRSKSVNAVLMDQDPNLSSSPATDHQPQTETIAKTQPCSNTTTVAVNKDHDDHHDDVVIKNNSVQLSSSPKNSNKTNVVTITSIAKVSSNLLPPSRPASAAAAAETQVPTSSCSVPGDVIEPSLHFDSPISNTSQQSVHLQHNLLHNHHHHPHHHHHHQQQQHHLHHPHSNQQQHHHHQQLHSTQHQHHLHHHHPQQQLQPPPTPQQATSVTTTAAVITVVAPSIQPSVCTEMISSQPVVVQVSSGNHQYIDVATADNTNDPRVAQANHSMKLEDADDSGAHTTTTYEDFSSVYSNGSNSAGQMAYYVTDPYTQGYYNPSGVDTYLLLDQTAVNEDPTSSVTTASVLNHHPHHQNLANTVDTNNQNNCTVLSSTPLSHRDSSNVLSDEEYPMSGKSGYQPSRMSVQPQTVDWLLQNYETADGVSLPRSTLYSHYQQHCDQNRIDPVNAASFGKLIRSVFVGLRTRRLGTRGNSKYHYYGIRIKPDSPLNDHRNGTSLENSTTPPVKRSKLSNNKTANTNNLSQLSNSNNHSSDVVNNHPPPPHHHHHHPNHQNHVHHHHHNNNNHHQQQQLSTTTATGATISVIPTSKESLQSYLGDGSHLLNTVWPQPSPPINQLPNGQQSHETESQKMLNVFIKRYRAHYDRMILALSELNFHDIESIWHSFWQATNRHLDDDTTDYLNVENLKDLTKSDFSNWIAQTDYTMYNSIITNLLLPNLLKPIPQILTQQIRNFAKCINKWMINALQDYPDEFIRLKISAVSALSHMLRRYTSLNHLSTAACAVLKNQQQVLQMISDLNKVDFKNVQEQASWVCQCDEEIVHQVEDSFKTFLQEPNPWERWALWCEQVLNTCLPDNNISAAKQFFFKWEFYSSLVMRDLTLRSAQSFGSFHLIRLLFDEYIFYLIEQRISKATNTTPLQMLGELTPTSSTTAAVATTTTSTIEANNNNTNGKLVSNQPDTKTIATTTING